MLIRACSGPRSSIIQQTDLFSIQMVLLLVVVVMVGWGGLGRRDRIFFSKITPRHAMHAHTLCVSAYAHRYSEPVRASQYQLLCLAGCFFMNNISMVLQGQVMQGVELVGPSAATTLDQRGEKRSSRSSCSSSATYIFTVINTLLIMMSRLLTPLSEVNQSLAVICQTGQFCISLRATLIYTVIPE